MKQGVLLLVDFNPTMGSEQRGIRPGLVLSSSVVASHQRYPLIVIAPLTSTSLRGPLYPLVEAIPTSGLSNPSRVLVDQLRAVDRIRVKRRLGAVRASELEAVNHALRLLFGV